MITGLRRLTYDRLHGLSLTRRLVTVVVLLVLAAYSFVLKRADWRTKLAEVEAGETER